MNGVSIRCGKVVFSVVQMLACAAVYAQSWPQKPIRVIVPMATGGGSDSVARILSPKLAEALGQQFIVDNRGGGGGLIGIGMTVKVTCPL